MIVIVDTGLGNLGSIKNMIKKAGGEVCVSADPAAILRASKLILPGIGAFDHGMKQLRASGILPSLNKKALDSKAPLLGICLGMQFFTKKSEEGSLPGLGWLNAETVRFPESTLKIPHMGWNNVKIKKGNPLLEENCPEQRFYFIHSYHIQCRDSEDVWLTSDYGIEFVSGVRRGNLYGVQFHPEKSHQFGMRMIKNFLEITE